MNSSHCFLISSLDCFDLSPSLRKTRSGLTTQLPLWWPLQVTEWSTIVLIWLLAVSSTKFNLSSFTIMLKLWSTWFAHVRYYTYIWIYLYLYLYLYSSHQFIYRIFFSLPISSYNCLFCSCCNYAVLLWRLLKISNTPRTTHSWTWALLMPLYTLSLLPGNAFYLYSSDLWILIWLIWSMSITTMYFLWSALLIDWQLTNWWPFMTWPIACSTTIILFCHILYSFPLLRDHLGISTLLSVCMMVACLFQGYWVAVSRRMIQILSMHILKLTSISQFYTRNLSHKWAIEVKGPTFEKSLSHVLSAMFHFQFIWLINQLPFRFQKFTFTDLNNYSISSQSTIEYHS